MVKQNDSSLRYIKGQFLPIPATGLDYFYVAIPGLDFIPKAIDLALHLRGVLHNIVKPNDSTTANKGGVQFKIGTDSAVGMVSVNKQKV